MLKAKCITKTNRIILELHNTISNSIHQFDKREISLELISLHHKRKTGQTSMSTREAKPSQYTNAWCINHSQKHQNQLGVWKRNPPASKTQEGVFEIALGHQAHVLLSHSIILQGDQPNKKGRGSGLQRVWQSSVLNWTRSECNSTWH